MMVKCLGGPFHGDELDPSRGAPVGPRIIRFTRRPRPAITDQTSPEPVSADYRLEGSGEHRRLVYDPGS